MRKVKIKLKTISPLTSFGAYKNQREFRVTEIKALLRSTFRELYYFKDIEDMKRKENFLFGSTENKSPVSIILIPQKKEEISDSDFEMNTEFEICFVERNKKEYSNINFLKFYVKG